MLATIPVLNIASKPNSHLIPRKRQMFQKKEMLLKASKAFGWQGEPAVEGCDAPSPWDLDSLPYLDGCRETSNLTQRVQKTVNKLPPTSEKNFTWHITPHLSP